MEIDLSIEQNTVQNLACANIESISHIKTNYRYLGTWRGKSYHSSEIDYWLHDMTEEKSQFTFNFFQKKKF